MPLQLNNYEREAYTISIMIIISASASRTENIQSVICVCVSMGPVCETIKIAYALLKAR